MSIDRRRGGVLLGTAALAAAVAGCGFDVQLVGPGGAGGHGAVTVTTGVDPITSGVGGEGSSAFSASSGSTDCAGLKKCSMCDVTTCEGSACIVQPGFCDGNDICDTTVDQCAPPPDQCLGATCGTPCQCDPSTMICDSDLFMCNEGMCQPVFASCSLDYHPCTAATCGTLCSICAPGDPDCFDPGYPTVCDSMGGCNLPSTSDCNQTTCAPGDPCGTPCWMCDPTDPGCQMKIGNGSPEGSCDPFGKCLFDFEVYCPCPPTMMGACALSCQFCGPMDVGCVEPGPPDKVCDSAGNCVPQMMCN